VAELTQPVVVANDWTTLDVPEVGAFQPTKSVSVVIPAHQPRHLPHVLAALAAQSYPPHLLEVVVVDDASQPPLVLPEVRPENTQLVTTTAGWGPGAARSTGVEHSEGAVLHWLDADMVPCREEVEAQLRWHHVIDYAVVIGDRVFVEDDALAHLTPLQLRDAVAGGHRPDQLSLGQRAQEDWVHRILAETAQLSTAGPRAMRVHVTGSSSVTRDLYVASGGFPLEVRYGEDTVLGYRLREAGAVFIPGPGAISAHLGSTHVQRDRDTVNRYAKPFITDKVPEFRGHRLMVSRSYEVPYVEVVVPVEGAIFEDVCALVNGQLVSSVPDLVVTLVAPWPPVPGVRRQVLDSPDADLQLLHATYASEPRVRLVADAWPLSDATFRLRLPGVECYPTGNTLEKLLHTLETEHLGLARLATAGGIAYLERTAAAARSQRITGRQQAELVYAAADLGADESGFAASETAPPLHQVRGLVSWGVRDARMRPDQSLDPVHPAGGGDRRQFPASRRPRGT